MSSKRSTNVFRAPREFPSNAVSSISPEMTNRFLARKSLKQKNAVKEERIGESSQRGRMTRERAREVSKIFAATLERRRSFISGYYHNRIRVLCLSLSLSRARVTARQVHRAKWDSLRARESQRDHQNENATRADWPPRRVFRAGIFRTRQCPLDCF